MYKLKVDLHWTAGEYFWPTDRLVEFDGDDIAASASPQTRAPGSLPPAFPQPPARPASVHGFAGYPPPPSMYPPPGSASPQIPVGYGMGPPPTHHSGTAEKEELKHKVEESGGKLLSESGITILSDWNGAARASAGAVERVPFISHGELKKFVVNVLLTVFIP